MIHNLFAFSLLFFIVKYWISRFLLSLQLLFLRLQPVVCIVSPNQITSNLYKHYVIVLLGIKYMCANDCVTFSINFYVSLRWIHLNIEEDSK